MDDSMELDVDATAAVPEDDDIYSELDSEEFVEDMRAYGVRQLLPLSDDDPDAACDSEAIAYLRGVREEAARLPTVCVSHINARDFDDRRTRTFLPNDDILTACPDPPHPWVCAVTDQFIAARQQVVLDRAAPAPAAAVKLPVLHDRQAWQRLIAQEGFQPLSTTLARMDNALATACLAHLAAQAATADALPGHLGLWMYGLLVRIEKPVPVAVAATIREVSKLARARRPAGTGAALSEAEVAQVAMYDTLLVVAGGFFGQDERLAPIVDAHISSAHS